MTHPNQGAAPLIDREADVLMPTAENAAPSAFVPGAAISTTDVLEIAMMFLLQLTGTECKFPPGALRSQKMDAARVGLLSPEAQRWMKPLEQPTT